MLERLFKVLVWSSLVALPAAAQEVLSLDEAIRIALVKNYAVLSASNSLQIADAQNNLGAAGMSPTISLNGSLSNSNLNSNQVFNTGVVQDRKGAVSSGINASINADWTVFDGMRMFAIRKRLDLNEGLTAISLRQQMEATVYEVMKSYFEIVRLNELLKAGRLNIKMYEERKKIADLRLQIGSDSKVEVLLSRSDLNKALSTQQSLELQLLQAKANLNTQLARTVSQDFTVQDSLTINFKPELEDLKKSASTTNSSLQLARQNELIFGQSVNEAKSASLPFVTLSGAYVFTKTQSQAGFLFSNRQNGLNFGLNARWTLFNGGRTTQLVKERQLLALNQKLFTEKTQLDVDALVYFNYQSFLINQKLAAFEAESLADAREVQFISLERYRVGKGTLLETIETQKNLEDAQSRYINALYGIKLAELELLRANGSLIKESK